jgi:hypothetical protein
LFEQGLSMSLKGLQLDLQGIPAHVHRPLTDFVQRVQTLLKDNLQGITVVGSCLTVDFRPGVSDINTILMLEEHHQGVLVGLADLVKPLRKDRFSPPLAMTEDYLNRSQQVFGIEWLEFQRLHRTILGPDPLAGLSFQKSDVRLQCERELKATLVRLRQGFIAAAGDKAVVRDILIATAKALGPILRAMLWLVDLTHTPDRESTFQQAWEAFGIEAQGLVSVWTWHDLHQRPSQKDLQVAFDSVYGMVDQLAYFVDDLEI